MAILAIETENNLGVKIFMTQANNRLQKYDIFTQAYRGHIKEFKAGKNKLNYLILMKPAFPPFYLMGAFFGLLILFIKQTIFTWWNIPSITFLLLGLFWSKYFIYIILKFGLKKKGYKGKVNLISNTKVLSSIIEYVL